ncbi:Aquaporin-like protein [Artemisia annua]|uniref:Aquaporin-like protein n=1 Tax=Artemisia annua TaxID=35608 RepID=A0A2U1LY14_ARTAN|nr:Aquaporin-like protein [Artemisia annua]
MSGDIEGVNDQINGDGGFQQPLEAPFFELEERTKWSFYRAIIAEFVGTFLFLYVTILTVVGYKSQNDLTKNPDVAGLASLALRGLWRNDIYLCLQYRWYIW